MENNSIHFSKLTRERQDKILNGNENYFSKFFSSEILKELNKSVIELSNRCGFEPLEIHFNYLGEIVLRGSFLFTKIYDTIEKLLVEEKSNATNFKKIMKMVQILKEIELVLSGKNCVSYKMMRGNLRIYSESRFSNLTKEMRKDGIKKIILLTKDPKIKKDAKALEIESIYEGDVKWDKVKHLFRDFLREKRNEMKEFEDYLIEKNAELNYFLQEEKVRLSSEENIRKMLCEYDEIFFNEKNQLVWK